MVLVAGSLLLAGCEEVLEPSLEDKKVHLLGPANNLVTLDSTHSFFWDELKGATHYQLQVVTPNYAAPVYLVADTTITKLYFDIELPSGQYQWRVRAKNSSTASQYSDTFNLVIQ
jgi:hypothetical protein